MLIKLHLFFNSSFCKPVANSIVRHVVTVVYMLLMKLSSVTISYYKDNWLYGRYLCYEAVPAIVVMHISPFQNAFTPERSIHDNLLLVQEILNVFKKSKSKVGWCDLKLDMEKAYDRIEWDFLWAALDKLGFPVKWINWVKACVTYVSYSIKVSNATTDVFTPSRGLRQGDPLSPYLFIICMEVFIIMLNNVSANSTMGLGFKVAPQTARIPCLMFADDNLLLCKAINSACQNLLKVITDFCKLSGLLVNFHKSAIIFSKNITHSKRDSLASIFNMTKSEALVRYLGAHFSSFTPTRADFFTYYAENESHINSWQANFLSKAGIHRQFFWNQSQLGKALPLIAWKKVCQPKDQGGLGLRRTYPLNRAFIAKLGWKILTEENNLWVKIMRKKYLQNNNSFFTVKKKTRDSVIWNHILNQREILRKGIRWRLGNGKSINFWRDNWIGQYALIDLPVIAQNASNEETTVAHFIDDRKNWNIEKLSSILPPEIVQKIKGIPIPVNDLPDNPIWGCTNSREFSVKSATWLAHDLPVSSEKWKFKWISYNAFKEWEFRLLMDSHQLKGTPFTTLQLPNNHPTTSPPIMVRWFPPPTDAFKLNFDGSCKSSSAAAGIIMRDSNGKTISAKSFNLGKTQVYMAEAIALHKGIQEAICLGIKDIYIEDVV
ncbi:uncharacterized protein [Spinacia oleracea]|uniref:Reverse transcriptase domain-containing protein n=1 Tax=Spinacia oleracea TaxID=3562 RepID=A0ABM3RQI1_SPIOL|nr:uncharacterized protein LOC130471653 [Spinacia oleracea]